MSNFAEILNPYIRTRPQVRKKDGTWVDKTETNIIEKISMHSGTRVDVSEGYHVAFETKADKTIFESILISGTEDVTPVMWLEKRNVGNTGALTNMFYIMGNELRYNPSLGIINDFGSDYFTIIEENTFGTARGFSAKLQSPFELPRGCTLAFRATNDYPSEGVVNYKIVVREFWEVEN